MLKWNISFFSWVLALGFFFQSLGVSAGERSYDYPKMFDYSLKMLTKKPVREFLRENFKSLLAADTSMIETFGPQAPLKDLSESQFLLLLQENPDQWALLDEYLSKVADLKDGDSTLSQLRLQFRKRFRQLIKSPAIQDGFVKLNIGKLSPFRLDTPDGSPGYTDIQLFVDHETMVNGKSVPASNLKQVWIEMIKAAKKEIVLNVFDFDLKEVAEALIAQHQAGLKVRVGIDAGVIQARPEVNEVFEMLVSAGVQVRGVDSVGLNHQKLLAIDWSAPEDARVLFSSGNLTQSCIGPEGDLVGVEPRPQVSVPNANHVITVRSYLLANLINHELTKTIDLGLRGRDYPLSGVYEVQGPLNKKGEATSVRVAFSPSGAFGDINKDIISSMILNSKGSVRMVQFAFSSKEVEKALLTRAKNDIKNTGQFDFALLGDTPFSMMDWSIGLHMSGLKLVQNKGKKQYVSDPENPWPVVLGQEKFKDFQKSIRIAPLWYGNNHYAMKQDDGTTKSVPVTSKIHHKLVVSGDQFVTGSYNFSEGALDNQEYILWFKDSELAPQMAGIFDGLRKDSQSSIADLARKRNKLPADDSGATGTEDAESAQVQAKATQLKRAANQ